MLIKTIEDLGPMPELAVIINCSTRNVSTLALLAALRYAQMPVVLIDCESTDGSYEHFLDLSNKYDFHLLQAPLLPHGKALDKLFQNVLVDKVLLIDSDLEILSSEIIDFMRKYIEHPACFGAGFVQDLISMDAPKLSLYDGAYYQERPWIPLTMLKTSEIRRALSAGQSFAAVTIYNECGPFQGLGRRFAEARVDHPILTKLGRLSARILGQSFHGMKPPLLYFDTGARIQIYLKYIKERSFVGLPMRYHDRFCTHFDGMTRDEMGQTSRTRATRKDIDSKVRERLCNLYSLEIGPLQHKPIDN